MENQVKLFNDGDRCILFENFDDFIDELTKYLPLEFKVIKKLNYDPHINEYLNNEEDDVNRRFNPFDCYLVKISPILYKENTINYLVVAPHFSGFSGNLLRIAAVNDESILNDDYIDMHKCKYFSIASCSRINEVYDNEPAENEFENELLKYNNKEITKKQLIDYIFNSQNSYNLYCPMTEKSRIIKPNCFFSSMKMIYLTNYRKIQRFGATDNMNLGEFILKNNLSEYDIIINPRFKKILCKIKSTRNRK